ncbi:MAG TPA: SH3 domain-containing protein, partial [Hyphomicrobiaceae bacterium]|nr:SH3 domain-containing protein [Hyphomicrobiaceae bacterium]
RQGPSFDQKVLWVYRRAGLPVEVLREHEGWLQIRDSEAGTGWVLSSLVSARRTALVAPWEVKPGVAPPQIEIRSEPSAASPLVALVEAGVIASLVSCDRRWCRIAINDIRGFVDQKRLWGVYEDEVLK